MKHCLAVFTVPTERLCCQVESEVFLNFMYTHMPAGPLCSFLRWEISNNILLLPTAGCRFGPTKLMVIHDG